MENNEKIDESKLRFSSLDWASTHYSILIGGIGGIGSWLSLFLARIGHNLLLVDDDKIDKTNLAGQCFRVSSIGLYKSGSIESIIREFCSLNPDQRIYHDIDKLAPYHADYRDIFISCFDNMEARKKMLDMFKSNINCEVFIDCRMQAEYFEVYLVTRDNIDQYEKEYIFPDSDVPDLMCSAKATTHCGAACAAFAVNMLNMYISSNLDSVDLSTLPLKVSMHLPTLNFEIIDNKYARV